MGGVPAGDFGALDQLAVRLICLDDSFDAPLREMGRVIGERIAKERTARERIDAEQNERPIYLEEALSTLISACGLEGVIDSRLVHRNSEEALLQITGCAEVLDEQVPNVGRAVCGFDAGLFEGFLRGVTGEETLNVEEVTCLGLGHSCCEFRIQRRQLPNGRKEAI